MNDKIGGETAIPIADDPRQWRHNHSVEQAKRDLQWLRDYGARVLAEREAIEAEAIPHD